MFRVAYVLTSDGKDIFADMALISMISVKISNPDLSIVVICDHQSAKAINIQRHRLLEICDELIPVQVPDGPAVFKNRWIKSQLSHYVKDDVLYLDADTLVRGSLALLPELVHELGGVANHNGSTFSEQIWSEDASVSSMMGWPIDFKTYINGGMFFYKKCHAVDLFFAKWNELLIAGISANGRLRDQPSLNSAIVASGVHLTELPAVYNKQLIMPWRQTADSIVWHFYATHDWNENPLYYIVKKVKKTNTNKLYHLIKRVIDAPAPWPNLGFAARILAKRVEVRHNVSVEELLWLKGRRFDAIRYLAGKIKCCYKNTISK
jgi:hypothetical protein